jgi:hypothetical protein
VPQEGPLTLTVHAVNTYCFLPVAGLVGASMLASPGLTNASMTTAWQIDDGSRACEAGTKDKHPMSQTTWGHTSTALQLCSPPRLRLTH